MGNYFGEESDDGIFPAFSLAELFSHWKRLVVYGLNTGGAGRRGVDTSLLGDTFFPGVRKNRFRLVGEAIK